MRIEHLDIEDTINAQLYVILGHRHLAADLNGLLSQIVDELD